MNAPLRGKPHLDIDRVIHQVENSKDKKEE